MEQELKELKMYVFAMHLGQKVLMHPKTNGQWFVTGNNLLGEEYAKECYLQPRNLNSISDSEAIEIAKILGYEASKLDANGWRGYIKSYLEPILPSKHGDMPFILYQHLQQNGFALPIFYKGTHYTVEKLVEMGIYSLIK